ncbi:MAG: DUF72 domain-containing protein [Xanthomonadales bacterium]|nr:DUF72 domain-containing protein [Xanthomonadales bacterium]
MARAPRHETEAVAASPGRVRIGTAGWSLPAASRDAFAAGGHQLARYASRLHAVEINSSFYRPHARATWERWAGLVPDEFEFSVKLPRRITHEARLVDAGGLLQAFFADAAGLGHKLARVLVQLPPSLAFASETAERFFGQLRDAAPGVGLACEPRHPGWAAPEADALLRAFGVTRVAADPPPFSGAGEAGGAPPPYFRWHGSPRMYYDSYDETRLQVLATSLAHAPGAWVIFDNTAHGHATANALRLQALASAGLRGRAGSPPADGR